MTRPLSENVTEVKTIELLDNGGFQDVIKDDGIYSNKFFQTSGQGRYSIKVLASGNDGQAAVAKGHMLGIGPMGDEEYDILG